MQKIKRLKTTGDVHICSCFIALRGPEFVRSLMSRGLSALWGHKQISYFYQHKLFLTRLILDLRLVLDCFDGSEVTKAWHQGEVSVCMWVLKKGRGVGVWYSAGTDEGNRSIWKATRHTHTNTKRVLVSLHGNRTPCHRAGSSVLEFAADIGLRFHASRDSSVVHKHDARVYTQTLQQIKV